MPKIVVPDTLEITSLERSNLESQLQKLQTRWGFADEILAVFGAKLDVYPLRHRLIQCCVYKFRFTFGSTAVTWYTVFTDIGLWISLNADQLELVSTASAQRPVSSLELVRLVSRNWRQAYPESDDLSTDLRAQYRLTNQALRSFLISMREDLLGRATWEFDLKTTEGWTNAANLLRDYLEREAEQPIL